MTLLRCEGGRLDKIQDCALPGLSLPTKFYLSITLLALPRLSLPTKLYLSITLLVRYRAINHYVCYYDRRRENYSRVHVPTLVGEIMRFNFWAS